MLADLNCSNGHCENSATYIDNFCKEGGLEEFLMYLLFVSIVLICVLCLLEQQMFEKLRLMFSTKRKKSDCELYPIANSPRSFIMSEWQPLTAGAAVNSEIEMEKNIIHQAIFERKVFWYA